MVTDIFHVGFVLNNMHLKDTTRKETQISEDEINDDCQLIS